MAHTSVRVVNAQAIEALEKLAALAVALETYHLPFDAAVKVEEVRVAARRAIELLARKAS